MMIAMITEVVNFIRIGSFRCVLAWITPTVKEIRFSYGTVLVRRTFIHCAQPSRTIRSNCQVHQPVLFPKKLLKFRGVRVLATQPPDPTHTHKRGNTFEATFPSDPLRLIEDACSRLIPGVL